jgi:WD40 repeat protein
MNPRIEEETARLLASAEGEAWQARLTDCFYDEAAKRAAIDGIQRGLANIQLTTISSKDDREALRQMVIRRLVAEAFRTARPPERPASAEPTLPTGVELQDRIIDTYPGPIATPYRAFVEQHSPASAFGCLLDTFEGLLHYLATVVVSSYFRAGLFDEHCNRVLLEKFFKQEWSAGDLAWLLDQTVRCSGDCRGQLPYAELPAYLFTEQKKPSASHQVLAALVSLRNRVWGHGAGRTDDFFQPLLEPHRKMLEAELARMAWLTSWELILPSIIDEQGVVREADLLMGERLRSRRQYELQLAQEDLDPDDTVVRVGRSLLLVDGTRHRYLPLFPLALFHFELSRQGTYFLQRLRWNAPEEGRRLRKAVYVAYDARLTNYEEQAGDPAVASLESWVKRLHSQLPEAAVAAEPPTSPEAHDPDYELAEVRWEQDSHLRNFAGREEDLESITRWLDTRREGAYLLVLGPPGQGKSALLAELARREAKRASCLLHMIKTHRNPLRFVPSLISQASRVSDTRFGADAYCGDLEDLRNSLVRALQRICEVTGKATVFLDALDELERSDHRLDFLPTALPSGVRVVLSCRPDIPLVQNLRSRLPGLREYPLQPLGDQDFPPILEQRLGSAARIIAEKIDLARLFRRLQGNALLLRRALDRLSMALESPDPDAALATFDIEAFPNDLDTLFGDIYDEIAEKRVGPSIAGEDKAKLLHLIAMARQPIGLNELPELMGLAGRPLSLEACRDRLLQTSQYLLDTGSGRFKPWHQGLTDFLRARILGEAGVREVEEVFCRWLKGPAGQTSYGILHRCDHLLAAGRASDAAKVLLDQKHLEAKAAAGLGVNLVEDFTAVLGQLSPDDPRRSLLRLLDEALRADLHFVLRHPQLLFQCLWNRGWWYDAPQAAKHYVRPIGGSYENSTEGTRQESVLSAFLESWRASREQGNIALPCVLSRRPPLDHLGGAQVAALAGHEGMITDLDISPDGRRVVSVSSDGTARLWDISTGSQLRNVGLGSQPWPGVTYSPDGNQIAFALNRRVEVWDANLSASLRSFEEERVKRSVAISSDGSQIAFGGKKLRVCDINSDQELLLIDLGNGVLEHIMFSPQAARLFGVVQEFRREPTPSSANSTVRAWDSRTGKELFRIPSQWFAPHMSISPDGRVLALAEFNIMRFLDTETGAVLMVIKGEGQLINSVDFSPDGKWLVTGGDSIRVWDVTNGQLLRDYCNQLGFVRRVVFTPDGKNLISGGDDNTIRVWDVEYEVEERELISHGEFVSDLIFSPDGKNLITCGGDCTVRVWDTDTGLEVHRLQEESEREGNLTLSDDGRYIAVSGNDNTLRVWELVTGRQSLFIEDSARKFDYGQSVFFPDGKRIAVSLNDGSVGVWDVRSGDELLRLSGYAAPVWNLAVSPDGMCLATGGSTVNLWDAQTGQRITSMLGADQQLHAVAFAPDGSVICTAGETLQIWDIATGKERIRFAKQEKGPGRSIVYSQGDVHSSYGQLDPEDEGFYEPCVSLIIFSLDGHYLVTQSGILTHSQTMIWDTRTGKMKETIEGALDPYPIAAGAKHFAWRARGTELETVIESAVDARPVAWFASVDRVAAHPSGKLWAGAQGRHLYLFELRQA